MFLGFSLRVFSEANAWNGTGNFERSNRILGGELAAGAPFYISLVSNFCRHYDTNGTCISKWILRIFFEKLDQFFQVNFPN